jgi:cardiolipin synthase
MISSFDHSWQEVGGSMESYGGDGRDGVTSNVVDGHSGRARFITSSASSPQTRTLFLAALGAAQHSVLITNPFVLPDPEILTALRRTAEAGVDVRLLVPGGAAFERFKLIRFAMNRLYDSMLSAGVRIFEYQRAMLHAKTIVVDQAWCSVGSSNLDWRSLYYNHEADLASCDVAFVEQVARSFAHDVEHSEEMSLRKWRSRGWTQQAKELIAGAFQTQL